MCPLKPYYIDGPPLVVGTGGGNDIFSTLLAPPSLWEAGFRWSGAPGLAGMLSPCHDHTGEPDKEDDKLLIIRPDSKRFMRRPGKDGSKEIGFIDAAVSALVEQEHPYEIDRVYGCSLEEGTRGLTETFKRLGKRYGAIILVDLGSDIFYGGLRDTHVLSPMFDAMALRALVDSGVPGFLFEAGPGTDGELTPTALREAFVMSGAEAHPLQTGPLEQWESLFTKWIKPHRPGRTVEYTLRAFRTSEEVIRETYRGRAHLGAKRWYANFQHEIDPALGKFFYLTDPHRIKNPLAIACESPFDWFCETQLDPATRTNNELSLEYFWVDEGLGQFLTPSPLFTPEVRNEIIEAALQDEFEGRYCDVQWMFVDDWQNHRTKWSTQFKATPEYGLISLRRK